MTIATYLKTFLDQSTRPVYNELTRNIGYSTSDQELAAGRIMLYTGETLGKPENWRVKNLLGVLEPASTYLIKKGLYPVWLTKAETQAQASEIKGPVATPPKVPAIQLPTNISPSNDGSPIVVQGTNLGTIALWGAVGILAFAIVSKRA